MAYALLLVFLLGIGYLIRIDRASGAVLPRLFVGGFLGIAAVLLSGILYFSIGRAGSEPNRATRRFEALGFAVADAPTVVLRGRGATVAPVWDALPPGAKVELRDDPNGFRATYSGPPAVVRLGGVTLATPAAGWIGDGKSQEFRVGEVRFTLATEGEKAVVRSPIDKGTKPVALLRQLSMADLLLKAGADRTLARLRRIDGFSPDDATIVRRVAGEVSPLGILAGKTKTGEPVIGDGTLSVWRGRVRALKIEKTARRFGATSRRMFAFSPPLSYALPPADEWTNAPGGRRKSVDLATVRTWATGDGYDVPSGDPLRPAILRAELIRDGDAIVVDGKERPTGEPFLIGDGPVAPVVRLSDRAAELAWQWIFPFFGLLIGAGTAGMGRYEGAGRRAPVAFVALAALLVVRAVIAFRVSTLLPAGMRESTAEEWLEAWPVAMALAGVGLPLAGLATFFAGGVYDPSARAKETRFDGVRFVGFAAYGVALAVSLVIAVAEKGFGKTTWHPWLFLALTAYAVFAGARGLADPSRPIGPTRELPKWAAALWPTVPLLFILITDLGYLLYAIPLLFAYAAARSAERGDRSRARPLVAAGAAFFLLLPLGPWVPIVGLAVLAAAFFAPAPEVARRWRILVGAAGVLLILIPFLRPGELASAAMRSPLAKIVAVQRVAESADRLAPALLDPRVPEGVAEGGERIAQQRWLMDRALDAAGTGMYRAPLVGESGLTYPTYLSDAVFATLLVAEHGPLAGWTTVALGALLGFVFLLAAFSAAEFPERRLAVRALALAGGLFALVGPYLALANHWKVPFTGLNIPFLGISSKIDGAGYLLVACLAIVLVGRPATRHLRSSLALKNRPSVAMPFVAAGAVPVVWLLVLAAISFPDANGAKAAFEPDPAAMAALRNRVDRLGEGERLLGSPAFANAGPRIARYAARFDRGVEDVPLFRDGDDVTVDPTRVVLGSPFDRGGGPKWRGTMALTGLEPGPVVVFGDGRRAVRLVAGGPDRNFARRDPGVAEDRAGSVQIGGARVARDGDGAVVIPRPGARVTVNGERITGRKRIAGAATVSAGRTVAVTLSAPGGLVALRRRNGAVERVYPFADRLPTATRWASAADAAERREARLEDEPVATSLDGRLQEGIGDALAAFCRATGRPLTPAKRPRGEAVTTSVVLVEPTTGRIRAAVSYPALDPNEDPMDAPGDAGPRDRIRSARSGWIGLPRTVGSASKPVTLAALATSVGPEIADLRVDERRGVIDGRYRRLGDLELRRGIEFGDGGPGDLPQPVGMGDMLRYSRTYAAMTLGAIGLAPTGSSAFGPGRDVRWKDRPRSLALRENAPKLFAGRGGDLATETIRRSALLKGLRETFGGLVVRPERYDPESGAGFLPFPVPKGTRLAGDAVPTPQILRPSDFSFLDGGWMQYAIGGGENAWSPVAMAGHAARLATGLAVTPTLRADAPVVKEAVKGPLADEKWRERAIVTPMREVKTVFLLPSTVRLLADAGLTLEAKTGTIDNDFGRRCESLLFTLRKGGRPVLSGYLSLRDTGPRGAGGVRAKNRAFDAIAPAIVRFLKG